MNDWSTNVNRKNGKVWLEGVPLLNWGLGKECTFAGALEAALTITAHPMKYTDIMGFSGLAFRMRWMDRNKRGGVWGVSSPVGEFPEEIDILQKLTGWQFTYDNTGLTFDLADPTIIRFKQQIVTSIDEGKPVIAHLVEGNVGVIYGYKDEGETLIGRVYSVNENELVISISGDVGPFIMFLDQYTEPPSPENALKKALTFIVQNWKRKRGPKDENRYFYGETAYSDWIQGLADFEKYELNAKDTAEMFFANWWGFNCLSDARPAAVTFLRDHIADLGKKSQESLEKAVEFYEEEVKHIGSVFKAKNAFTGPWSDSSFENWSKNALKNWSNDMRKREQEILEKARQLESIAMREIEKALGLTE